MHFNKRKLWLDGIEQRLHLTPVDINYYRSDADLTVQTSPFAYLRVLHASEEHQWRGNLAHLLGVEVPEVGKSATELLVQRIHPDDASATVTRIRSHLETAESTNVQIYYRFARGSLCVHTAEATMETERDRKGRPLESLLLIRDTTRETVLGFATKTILASTRFLREATLGRELIKRVLRAFTEIGACRFAGFYQLFDEKAVLVEASGSLKWLGQEPERMALESLKSNKTLMLSEPSVDAAACPVALALPVFKSSGRLSVFVLWSNEFPLIPPEQIQELEALIKDVYETLNRLPWE